MKHESDEEGLSYATYVWDATHAASATFTRDKPQEEADSGTKAQKAYIYKDITT